MVKWAVPGLLLVLLATCLLAAPPAAARCVRADVAVYRYGQSDLVVAEGQCLAPTDYSEDVVVVQRDTHVGNPPGPPPTGTPTGARATVYVPL